MGLIYCKVGVFLLLGAFFSARCSFSCAVADEAAAARRCMCVRADTYVCASPGTCAEQPPRANSNDMERPLCDANRQLASCEVYGSKFRESTGTRHSRAKPSRVAQFVVVNCNAVVALVILSRSFWSPPPRRRRVRHASVDVTNFAAAAAAADAEAAKDAPDDRG